MSLQFFSTEVSVDVIERKKENGDEEHVILRIQAIENNEKRSNKSSTSLSSSVMNFDCSNSNIALDLFDFTVIFPYHICFDRLLVIEHCGLQIQKYFTDIVFKETMLFDLLEIVHPNISFNFQNIISYINSTFVAKLKQGPATIDNVPRLKGRPLKFVN